MGVQDWLVFLTLAFGTLLHPAERLLSFPLLKQPLSPLHLRLIQRQPQPRRRRQRHHVVDP